MYIWQIYINVNLIHQNFYFIYFSKSVNTDFFTYCPVTCKLKIWHKIVLKFVFNRANLQFDRIVLAEAKIKNKGD